MQVYENKLKKIKEKKIEKKRKERKMMKKTKNTQTHTNNLIYTDAARNIAKEKHSY